MIEENFLDKFVEQFDNLTSIVAESHQRVIADSPDPLFVDYANVFTKSYIVSACSILEAFIQELSFAYFRDIEDRIKLSNIPHNLIVWSMNSDVKKEKLKFERFSTNLDRIQFNDLISANVEKTIKIFKYVGIDIDSSEEFRSYKDVIASFVNKRNNIVHHNDDAVDVSFPDVIEKIQIIKLYCNCIFTIIKSSTYLSPLAE